MQTGPRLSLSSSFTSYSSSDNLAEIAARVVQELTADSDHSVFEFTYEGESNYPRNELENHADGDQLNRNDGDEDDDDFEFVVAASSPISADEIFYNGQILPVYPVFNTNLYFDGFGFVHGDAGSDFEKLPIPSPPPPRTRVRIPLGKLLREDRDPPSCSSSEADELDGVPAEIYCLWKPKTEEEDDEVASPGKCKKSNSVGSTSKRWKFRNLLYRSNSDGKDMLVFVPPPPRKRKGEEKAAAAAEERSGGGESEVLPEETVVLRRKGGKRRSYLPYRKDLVGLFANLHPF